METNDCPFASDAETVSSSVAVAYRAAHFRTRSRPLGTSASPIAPVIAESIRALPSDIEPANRRTTAELQRRGRNGWARFVT